MNDAGDNATSGTSHRISEDSGTASGKEVGHHSRKDHRKTEHREEKHADNRTDRRTQDVYKRQALCCANISVTS